MGDITRQGWNSQGGPPEEVNLKLGERGGGHFFLVEEPDSNGVGAGRSQLSSQRMASSRAWLEQRLLRWTRKERLGEGKEQPQN